MNEILDAVPVLNRTEAEQALDQLAQRYRAAGGAGVKIVNLVGTQAENLLDRLPDSVRTGLGTATEQALTLAVEAAGKSRNVIADQPAWLNTAMSSVLGAAGGFSGLPGTMVELPATVTLLMRSVQGVAAEHGFDPDAESVKFDCVRVFADGGPLSHDDGSDLGFISVRVSLSGVAMKKLIATVAPKLAVVLGQKLAAQTVPVLGAMSGAAVNYVYTDYYQQIAQVHFGLRRLAIDADISHDELVNGLRLRLGKS
ncbi:EcsC family protein [Aliisedimentitalea scapharcae]|uniref:EcsC family protein n=1 Tax=Aliisedimentitalea scapharcae TaxID=1524259 RepID=A0ABZ2XWQ4_9RHOB|nr:EcsC family protein [Rhodobacteraceae bacterium M382]